MRRLKSLKAEQLKLSRISNRARYGCQKYLPLSLGIPTMTTSI